MKGFIKTLPAEPTLLQQNWVYEKSVAPVMRQLDEHEPRSLDQLQWTDGLTFILIRLLEHGLIEMRDLPA